MARTRHVLVSYDVTDDRVRAQFAEELLDLGLVRNQYSLFEGEIPTKRVKNVIDICEKYIRMMNDDEVGPTKVGGAIQVIQLCSRCEDRIHRYHIDENAATELEEQDEFTIH